MELISVAGIRKDFTVTVGQKGFSGAIRNLLRPKKRVVHALDDVSFSIQSGEILGLLGPNGAGKSTTVKILTGILTPTAGKVSVGGLIPYEKPRQNAMQIGVVFGQRSRLWWTLPVRESFEYTRALYSIPKDTYEKNVRYFCEEFGIEELMTKPVRTLSLGQKMRAEISMAMLHDPAILYLDEPTIGLDVVGKNELHNQVRRINAERGVTVLLVTHDVLDIERLCERVIIIDKGKLRWQGDVEALRHVAGGKKRFNVVFAHRTAPVQSEYLKLLSNTEDMRHEYECVNDDTPINKIMACFFAAGTVADLTISDAPLDYVMRRIYAE